MAVVAREAAQRQADQNKQMAQLQGQVAEGSRQLVEAEPKARADMTALQRDLQQSQAEVGHQRDQLEAERRQIAAERYWDGIIGNSVTAAATPIRGRAGTPRAKCVHCLPVCRCAS